MHQRSTPTSMGRLGRVMLATVFVCGVVIGPSATVNAATVDPMTMQSPIELKIASVSTDGLLANQGNWEPSISNDGRYVVFESFADNLSDLDLNGDEAVDVYMHDTMTRETTLISAPRVGALEWNRGSRTPRISGDGRYIVFFSGQDLSSEDTDTVQDLYRYDRTTGMYDRADILEYGTSWDVAWGVQDFYIDDAGQHVVFSSYDELAPDDWVDRKDVYLYDFESQETTLVSQTPLTAGEWDRGAKPLGISDDGVYVLMLTGRDLTDDDNNLDQDIYRKNMLTGELDLVDIAGDGTEPLGNLWEDEASFSGNGRYAVFCVDQWSPLLPEDENDRSDVYMWDFVESELSLVSYTPEAAVEWDRGARSPAIDSDGSIITFFTGRDFVPTDTNGEQDVYAYYPGTGEYRYIDIQGDGSSPGDDLYDFILSGDGEYLTFISHEALYADGKYTASNEEQIFVKKLSLDIEDGDYRLAGASRYQTGVAISQETFPDGADTVVIATGENWPDALSASALAGAVDGPILLTPSTGLTSDVIAEIERLGASDAYICGGYTAVPLAVENQLEALLSGYVYRLAGADRYGTSKAIANAAIQLLDTRYDGTVFLTTGANFADAVAAAPLAAALAQPIVLVNPISGVVYQPADMTKAVILGGTTVVSQAVEDDMVDAFGAGMVVRLGGTSRYETAALIADYGVAEGMHWDGVGIATGANFPDALAGGAGLGRLGAVVLLTPSTSLHPAAQTRLTDNADDIDTFYVLGGTTVVSPAVYDQVKKIVIGP